MIDLDRPHTPAGGPPGSDDEPRSLGSRLVLALLTVIVLGFVAMWVYVFSGWARHAHVDTLDSDAFPMAAESRCAEVRTDFDALPQLRLIDTPSGRAEVIDEGVVVLRELVSDLRAIAPAAGTRDGDLATKWLADWDVHLEDRAAYSELLRAPDATLTTQFTEREDAGRRISDRLNRFAEVNFMESCKRPEDL